MSDHETVELVKKLRYDLTAMQGKVTELLRMLGDLELPESAPVRCAACGYVPAMNLPGLAEHMHTAHGAPEPAHYSLAVDDVTEAA